MKFAEPNKFRRKFRDMGHPRSVEFPHLAKTGPDMGHPRSVKETTAGARPVYKSFVKELLR